MALPWSSAIGAVTGVEETCETAAAAGDEGALE